MPSSEAGRLTGSRHFANIRLRVRGCMLFVFAFRPDLPCLRYTNVLYRHYSEHLDICGIFVYALISAALMAFSPVVLTGAINTVAEPRSRVADLCLLLP